MQKDTCVPAGTIEKPLAFGLARRSAIANFGRSSRSSFVVLTMADKPGRILFKNGNPALRTGLLSLSLFLRLPGYGGQAGTKVLTVQAQPLSWHRQAAAGWV
jgi:hypothetical protein